MIWFLYPEIRLCHIQADSLHLFTCYIIPISHVLRVQAFRFLNVWAADNIDLEKWNQSLLEHYSLVAVKNDIIIGFGDIDKTGYFDRLYVHKDYQRKGIASAICNKLEQTIQGKIITYASITAKPFFEKRGYKILKEQEVERKGIILINFIMKKYR